MKTLQEIFDFASNSLRENGNPYGTPHARGWSNINPDNLSEKCILAELCGITTTAMAIDFSEIVHVLFDKTCGTGTREYKFCTEIAGAFDRWNSLDNQEALLKDIAKRYELKYNAPSNKAVLQKEVKEITEEVL